MARTEYFDVTCMLFRDSNDDWVSCCPETGGTLSQGSSPEEAAAMLSEAVRLTIEDCLNLYRHHRDGSWSRNRIVHPRRLIKNAEFFLPEDEWWQEYRQFHDRSGKWSDQSFISFDDLELGTERFAFIESGFRWAIARGVVLVDHPHFTLHEDCVAVPAFSVSASVKTSNTRSYNPDLRLADLKGVDEAGIVELVRKQLGLNDSQHVVDIQVDTAALHKKLSE